MSYKPNALAKANKFLCFLPLCAVHQAHFTFITRDNVPGPGSPKATAGQGNPPLPSALFGLNENEGNGDGDGNANLCLSPEQRSSISSHD